MQKNNVQKLATAGMLLALSVIFGFLKIPITNTMEIRFQSLPVALAGMLLGPVPGMLVGALTDFLSYIVKPTGPYFMGFLVSYALIGLVFGLIARVSKSGAGMLARIICAQVITSVFIDALLNSYWLSVLYGSPFKAVLISRIPKEILMFFISCALLYLVVKPVRKYAAQYLPSDNKASRA
ncbi:folate family ECF transporter S component [Butyrivibrio sp. MC2013]|uniref:folate family ECF transporter S component n=1 Tax=Butyrivibrio sp. MC2013 TaxID=1280686 RepID=UPI00040CC2D6|nr:folate family ECF transporter S component [Butyrivibrio sp. MC2013]